MLDTVGEIVNNVKNRSCEVIQDFRSQLGIMSQETNGGFIMYFFSEVDRDLLPVGKQWKWLSSDTKYSSV